MNKFSAHDFMNPPENGDAWSHWISRIGSANHKEPKLKIKERKRPRPSSLIHLDTIGVTLDIRFSLCLHSPPPKWTKDETRLERRGTREEETFWRNRIKPGDLPIDNVRRRQIHQEFISVNLSVLWFIYLGFPAHYWFQLSFAKEGRLLRAEICRSQDWKTASNGRRHVSKSTIHFRHKRFISCGPGRYARHAWRLESDSSSKKLDSSGHPSLAFIHVECQCLF